MNKETRHPLGLVVVLLNSELLFVDVEIVGGVFFSNSYLSDYAIEKSLWGT